MLSYLALQPFSVVRGLSYFLGFSCGLDRKYLPQILAHGTLDLSAEVFGGGAFGCAWMVRALTTCTPVHGWFHSCMGHSEVAAPTQGEHESPSEEHAVSLVHSPWLSVSFSGCHGVRRSV